MLSDDSLLATKLDNELFACAKVDITEFSSVTRGLPARSSSGVPKMSVS